jgi:hypothetical protein
MKQDSKYDPKYIYATCSTKDLEEMTHVGWELVESFFEVIQDCHEISSEDVFPPEGNFASPGTRVQHQLGIPMYMTLFLIRRERGEYNKVKTLEAGLESQAKEVIDLAEEVKGLKEHLEASQQRYDGLMGDKDYYRKQYEESRDANQRMEGDISKLRQHFGEKAVKEALES